VDRQEQINSFLIFYPPTFFENFGQWCLFFIVKEKSSPCSQNLKGQKYHFFKKWYFFCALKKQVNKNNQKIVFWKLILAAFYIENDFTFYKKKFGFLKYTT